MSSPEPTDEEDDDHHRPQRTRGKPPMRRSKSPNRKFSRANFYKYNKSKLL